jgi:hypothetical protein
MKLIRDETAGAGQTRYVFHVSLKEIEVLDGLLDTALRYAPSTIGSMRLRSLMQGMRKSMRVVTDDSK